jgi:hypothetical protein
MGSDLTMGGDVAAVVAVVAADPALAMKTLNIMMMMIIMMQHVSHACEFLLSRMFGCFMLVRMHDVCIPGLMMDLFVCVLRHVLHDVPTF